MNIPQLRSTIGMMTVALLAGAIGTATAYGPESQEPVRDRTNQPESGQPGTDTWITTKVKADLLATEDVSGLALNVETVNGVVSLKGEVDSRAEADRAVAVARGIEGVKDVDSSGIKIRADATP